MSYIVYQKGLKVAKFATEEEAIAFCEGKKYCEVREPLDHAEYMKTHASYVDRVLDRNIRRSENHIPDED